ncbi:MAG: VCBS repeat-containing protein, partial [Verrucomicrobiota bacterium]
MLHPSQTPSLFRNWPTLYVAFHLLASSPGFTQDKLDIRSSRLNSPVTRSQTVSSGFTRIHKKDTGIDFQNLLKKEHIKKYLYTGAGVCVGDYDGDGLPDLYLISQDGKNKLFRQTAPWKFEDATAKAGVDGGDAWGSGASFVDIDNDGDLDIYVCNMGSPNLLYINQGDGTFTEEASNWGLDYNGASIMASFADYDRDGSIDCFLLTYRLFELAADHPNLKVRYVNQIPTVHPDLVGEYHFIEGHLHESGRQDLLFHNEGDGTFRNATGSSGLGKTLNLGLSSTWWDYNNDGWLDLYVANDFKDPDRLWRNNGDGTFIDVLPTLAPSTAWFAMGSDYGDINRDGWLDYSVSDMSATNHYTQKMRMGAMSNSSWFLEWAEPRQNMRNSVYLNSADAPFREIGFLSGLESTGWSWATRLADLDCDGWEDAIYTNGMARDVNNSDHLANLKDLNNAGKLDERTALMNAYDKSGAEHSKVFRNRGDLTFEDVSEKWNYNDKAASFGLICADLDRDGDLDLVVNNMNQPVGIYRNDTTSGHRLLIALHGRQSNHFGVGARLRLKSASGWQTRLLSLARGYMSADEPIIHFGLGDDNLIEQLEINWPSGAKQTLKNLKADQLYTITEPEGNHHPGPALRQPKPRQTLFSMDAVPGLKFTHQENKFDDYKENPLLPWRLSRFGPGIAFGDADNDGDEDLIIGGAAKQEAMLFLRSDTGRWISAPWGPWIKDNQSEDMGMLWFDPDKDGDLDLYITSGGSSFASTSPELEDRLYINMGKEGFGKAQPDPKERTLISGSVIAAADMDKDGDIDLFSGGRLNL